MPPLPILAIVESESYWLAECQRQLVGQADVRPCSKGEEFLERIEELRPSLLILAAEAVDSSLPHLVSRLCRVTRVITIVPAGAGAGEWWLRELGVDAVFTDDHPRDLVIDTCRRLLRAATARSPSRSTGWGGPLDPPTTSSDLS